MAAQRRSTSGRAIGSFACHSKLALLSKWTEVTVLFDWSACFLQACSACRRLRATSWFGSVNYPTTRLFDRSTDCNGTTLTKSLTTQSVCSLLLLKSCFGVSALATNIQHPQWSSTTTTATAPSHVKRAESSALQGCSRWIGNLNWE